MAEKLPIQYAKVTNPTAEDLVFKYDSATYVLKAGETEDKWLTHIAKQAAKKLADKNIMTTDPAEHRVLMGAYLENSEIEVIAKRLGIDLKRIRKKALTKAQKESKVLNLEALMESERRKREELEKKLDKLLEQRVKDDEVKKVEAKEVEESKEEPVKKVKKSKKK